MSNNDGSSLGVDEFLNNYWLILQLLQKNKRLTKKEKLKSGGDFFRDELHKLYETKDPEKKKFMAALSEECKKFQKIKKKNAEKMKLEKEEAEGTNLTSKHLDIVNNFARDHAKQLVSLENLINKTADSVFNKGMEKKLEERYEDDNKMVNYEDGKEVARSLIGYYSDEKAGIFLKLIYSWICTIENKGYK